MILEKNVFRCDSKSETICIPTNIKNAKINIITPFIRGLFFTDGTAYLSMNGNKKDYPKIEYSSSSKLIVDETSIFLKKQNMRNYTWIYKSKKDKNPQYFLRISGAAFCKKFNEKVGLANPVHRRRIQDILNKNI